MKKSNVDVAEAKRHLSDLLGRVAYAKETITIAQRGKPMARLVPLGPAPEHRHVASARGWLEEGNDFFGVIEAIVKSRRGHIPRTLSRRRK